MHKYFLLFFLCLVISVHANGISNKYNFGHLIYSDGLSHNNVQCFGEDNNGFLWIGTRNGLNRFDGYNFKVFKHSPSDPNSLPDNVIQSIVNDQLGRLWIQLPNKLSILNPNTEEFTNQFNLNCDSLNFSLFNLNMTLPYRDSILLFNVSGFGIIMHNIYTNENNCLTTVLKDSISSKNISHISIDDNILYIVHRNGIIDALDLIKKKVVKRNFTIFNLMDGQEHEYELFHDSRKNQWLFCKDKPIGLFRIDIKGQLKLINTESEPSLNSNIVSSLVEDSDNNIWIGTDHGGINIFSHEDNTITYLTNNPYNENSLSQNVVTKIYKSKDDIIWVGSFKQGISYYHKNLFRFFHFSSHQNDLNSLPNTIITNRSRIIRIMCVVFKSLAIINRKTSVVGANPKLIFTIY